MLSDRHHVSDDAGIFEPRRQARDRDLERKILTFGIGIDLCFVSGARFRDIVFASEALWHGCVAVEVRIRPKIKLRLFGFGSWRCA
ncbi:hypothetical protein ASE66_24445 [Bosea sp. Root483D1]|nr:hypothetical protein ASE66_24445 [Bosea sp. Root483D1]